MEPNHMKALVLLWVDVGLLYLCLYQHRGLSKIKSRNQKSRSTSDSRAARGIGILNHGLDGNRGTSEGSLRQDRHRVRVPLRRSVQPPISRAVSKSTNV